MFSAKFNFFQNVSITPPIFGSGTTIYWTMDYAHNAQPFIQISAQDENGTINTKAKQGSLDYVYLASPFYGNNINLLQQ